MENLKIALLLAILTPVVISASNMPKLNIPQFIKVKGSERVPDNRANLACDGIYIFNIHGEILSDLFDNTSTNGEREYPSFSPDHNNIVFDASYGLFVANVHSFHVHRLTSLYDRMPAWSPDGKSVAFVRKLDRYSCIYVINVANRRVRQLTCGHIDTSPTWSPKGGVLAFDTDRYGKSKILIVNVESGELKELRNQPQGFCSRPSWSWANDKIAYVNTTSSYYDYPASLVLSDPLGLSIRKILIPNLIADRVAWSPSGRQIAFTCAGSTYSQILETIDLRTMRRSRIYPQEGSTKNLDDVAW